MENLTFDEPTETCRPIATTWATIRVAGGTAVLKTRLCTCGQTHILSLTDGEVLP